LQEKVEVIEGDLTGAGLGMDSETLGFLQQKLDY
jgi:hypothetical protein